GGKRLRRNLRKHRGEVIGPGHRITCEVPREGGLAETGEDGRGLRSSGCHSRLVSGRAQLILKEDDNASLPADPRQNSLNNSKKPVPRQPESAIQPTVPPVACGLR